MAACVVARVVLFLCVLACSFLPSTAETVHGAPTKKMRGQAAPPPRKHLDLHAAVAEVLGSGHDVHHGQLLRIHEALKPLWRALPTNKHGRVDKKSLRYAVHRHLLHTRSLSLVGLESGQAGHISDSDAETVLLMKRLPSYVKTTLEGRAAQDGYSIEDAVAMVATLEQLVADTSRDLLTTVYATKGVAPGSALNRQEVRELLETYMLHWMMGDDTEGIEQLEENRTLLEEAFTDWHHIADFALGRVRAYEQGRLAATGRVTAGWQPLSPQFSDADVQSIASGITMSFGRFWETECGAVKESLLKMDKEGSGRVRLSDFYGAALNGEWRFSESKEYLRKLGALDETSRWQGPRVIIPNYLQAASNCIVSTPHYRVCCANECEDLLGELEIAVGRPMATPDEILKLVQNMTSTLDDDGPKLKPALLQQLRQLAEPHGGKIPLHGRLFAQWLHYVFPRECPFPHKSGDSKALSPLEFGDSYVATDEEMDLHVKAAPVHRAVSATPVQGLSGDENPEDLDFMSQWSHEEELLVDYANLVAPWEGSYVNTGMGVFLLLCAAGGLVFKALKADTSASLLPTTSGKAGDSRWGFGGKSHCV